MKLSKPGIFLINERKTIATTRNSKDFSATPETLYRVFTDSVALATWLAPEPKTMRKAQSCHLGNWHDMSRKITGAK
ncbi:MAG: hypothetical protein ABI472_14860 [Ginsengibacter sp.]